MSSSDDQLAHEGLAPCCRETIAMHGTFNPMMVCQSCKHLIKCFTNDVALRNYLTFCKSRGRQVVIDQYEQFRVVVFRTYETFR